MAEGLVEGLWLLEHELLLFAAFWFVIGAMDELSVDAIWLWLKVRGAARTRRLPAGYEQRPLSGRIAIMVPAWQEAAVIGEMVSHTLSAWAQRDLTLYIGCYANDPATLAAAMAGAGADDRIRLVIHNRCGPTTKADCLNRLYRAMSDDEKRYGFQFRGVVLHDAEDMVHPAALAVIERALDRFDFVQLPVRPEPHRGSQWVSGHYIDEFAESHTKDMVVRNALHAGIPAAGVGCGFSREALDDLAQLARSEDQGGPFSQECLTEDYELGLTVSRTGGGGCFLRLRDANNALVATRAFFPDTLETAVRQKARWIHGISLQGWDRLGWSRRPVDIWMAIRDRRGPLTALVLAAGYALLVIEAILMVLRAAGLIPPLTPTPVLKVLIMLSLAGCLWRAVWRFACTASEYGVIQGIRAVLRIPVANVIAIMAGRRALGAYIRVLRGGAVKWDKTSHDHHPAMTSPGARVSARIRVAAR